MIEWIWGLLTELAVFLEENYDPLVDTIDILIIATGIYWLLVLIRGTRAVQISLGLLLLVGASQLLSQFLQLVTVSWFLSSFVAWAPLIIIILFQHDIRRALARVGRGLFRNVSQREAALAVEEIVRAAQTLAQKRVGALIVVERETGLDDLVESGVAIDAAISKELLTALFLPYSPLHDGAVLVQSNRIASAGCILPLTLRTDLPEGVGTRHRAAVGITEETDALVVVVSEETGAISVVLGGELLRDLAAPRLRVVLRDTLARTGRELPPLEPGAAGEPPGTEAGHAQPAEVSEPPAAVEASRG